MPIAERSACHSELLATTASAGVRGSGLPTALVKRPFPFALCAFAGRLRWQGNLPNFDNCLVPAEKSKLAQNLGHVSLHGRLSQLEFRRNLAVLQAIPDQVQHAYLLRRQLLDPLEDGCLVLLPGAC